MDRTDVDLLVVGGGPGGSCAAAFARKKGLSVLLAERDRFPRFHIGESLLPIGNAILRDCGAWPKVEAAGFVRKLGAEFILGEGPQTKEIVFAEGYVPNLGSTFQVERRRFDSILLDHASSLGAEVRIGTTVRSLAEGEDSVVATLSGERGDEEVSARWVIDSGGRENLFAHPLKSRFEEAPFPKRAAVYSHFEGVRRADGPSGGNIVIARVGDGWFWVIPVSPTKTSVGLVTSVTNLRGRAAPEEAFAATVAGSPRLREVMSGACAVEPFRTTADYSYVRRQFASPRVVLGGDAAVFYDPIFSSGVYLSTRSSKLAVEMIWRAHEAGRPLRPAERRAYTRGLKAHCSVFKKLIDVFYDNSGFEVFMTPEPPWGLNSGIVSIVAGHVELAWPLWWRFKVFLAVCWLQRFIPLVPRITHSARVVSQPS
ncbi:MAG TPA: NAD(P)/FAD-dependent oxidoreductase [Opitutaceae bacterium]|jgi:flavin-dependent dehydrogenase